MATFLPVVLREDGLEEDIFYAYGLGLIAEEITRIGHKKSSPDTFFYHQDGLGSTVLLSGERGNPEATYEYDAWGNLQDDDGRVSNRYLFTGEEQDAMTRLYYLRARWYDPSVGRFISKDPSLGFLSSPRSLNKYIYAENNPIAITDPSGLRGIRDAGLQQSNLLLAASGSMVPSNLISRLATNVALFGAKAFEIITQGTSILSEGITFVGKAIGGYKFYEAGKNAINPSDQEVLAWIQIKENTPTGRFIIEGQILASLPPGKEISLDQWFLLTPEEKVKIVKSSVYYNTRPNLFRGAADLLWEGTGIVY